MTVTSSKAELTHRRVLGVAFPILISNITTPILGAVDTGVVGQLGEAAPIGAVGLGAIIITSIYWFFGFLRMGTVGLTSQALGAREFQEVDALLARVLIAGVVFGLILILIQIPTFWIALAILPGSAEVETLAQQYLGIRIWSAPAAVAIYGITGWLIAHERMLAVLMIQFWTNGLNVILDIWFVLIFDWGVEGVAFATFMAEWSGALLGLFFCRKVLWRKGFVEWEQIFDWGRLLNMALVNRDILLRSLLLQIIFVSFIFLSAEHGDVTLAANQVLLQFLYVATFTLDGFAIAAETLVGQAVGSRNLTFLRRSVLITFGWGLVMSIVLSVAFVVGGVQFIELMTTASEVREQAKAFLIWIFVAPIIGVWAWMLDGIFIGATQTRDMRNMMGVSFIVYWIAVAVLLQVFGDHGLWAALVISFLVRGISLGVCYSKIEAKCVGQPGGYAQNKILQQKD
ncbi:MAG: MATE family efflux transporter [Aestuariivita sp.]|nr:MATE family efflux transporter [Aestuariivita sp.]